MKGTTKGENIFKNIKNSFEKLGFLLKKLISLTTDGGKIWDMSRIKYK